MITRKLNHWLLIALIGLTVLSPARFVAAQEMQPAAVGETIRSSLLRAQLALTDDSAKATAEFQTARDAYQSAFTEPFAQYTPELNSAILASFSNAESALAQGDSASFATSRAQIWTSLLGASYQLVEQNLQQGAAPEAQRWLALREFRRATRFSRPNSDATMAISNLMTGTGTPDEALATVRADLLDTYQGRLNEAIADLRDPQTQTFPVRRNELAGLVAGYLNLLAPAYTEQRGAEGWQSLQAEIANLQAAASSGLEITPALNALDATLGGFRAAPLSAEEQQRRAGQMIRFLSLVAVEYERGIRDGRVAVDLELSEARTFRDGAAAAFSDLRDLLMLRDAEGTAQAAQLFESLARDLAAANSQSAPDPTQIQATSDQLHELLTTIMPEEWKSRDSSADFDVITTALDQMDQAAAAGSYDLAESARLEAYAILESGPEAKLLVFAPEYKPILEDLFWYGQGEQKGLAYLIQQRAPLEEIRATRTTLELRLDEAEKALVGNNAPAAVATNAAVIVFREGLEAVLILASLMGSLKIGDQRKLRQPLWIGTALAFLASALTWVLAQGALTAMARYGERLEAVVSLIAIAVLLLITNWFFHDVYWKDWMASFHQQKRRIMGSSSQWIGLITLGFASIYREGFETVLFLQALVLESGTLTVLAGVGIGLAGTFLVGLAVFGLQARLPHKRMLIVTGILIGAVLLQMVGNTIHVMQVVGWMSIHPIRWLELPYWAGFWLGLYATWEGIFFQIGAAVFVIGSYYLAEHMSHRERQAVLKRQAA